MDTKWMHPELLDAVVAAPNSHKIIIENNEVRVVEVVIKPGQKEPEHTHKWASVMIIDKPSKIVYYDENNISQEVSKDENITTPIVEWMDPEGPHAVENIDNTIYHAIRIELKK